MFHLSGKLCEEMEDCETNLFSDKNKILVLSHQNNNTYLFYSKSTKPKFEKYFKSYKILKHHFWNPAFNIVGSELLECKQSNNFYLIGDHNICGLEDSYITGIYAANQIGKNSK